LFDVRPHEPAPAAPGPDALGPWGKRGLALLAVVVIAFGVLVEIRSAFLKRRMGDLSVFMRAAWAVRSGADLYQVTDENDFHYHYPPLFAILLVPLADPPPGVSQPWTVPYPVTVALCYAGNVLCLALAVHLLASALERSSPDPSARGVPRGGRRWWALRVLPVLACLPPVGHTLMRGQVNLLLLLLLCGAAAATLRGRSWRAGLWLSGAVCLKVIPALLLAYPLARRDVRCLAGCALGLAVGLGAVPAAVFGPARTVAYYREWVHVLVGPGLSPGGDSDPARDNELIKITATDSQSFQAVFHNALYPDRATRLPFPSAGVRAAHWLAAGLMTALTLLAARRGRGDGPGEVIAFGALSVTMVLASPVCHLHYFAASVPLVMGCLAASWERSGAARLGAGALLLGAANVAANTLPNLPGMLVLRDGGLATAAALLLWGTGVVLLWRGGGRRGAAARPAGGLAAAA
jgi:hypothetical protein